MERRHVQVVHKQYNSPLGLYSSEAIAETLNRQTRVLANGAVGIDFRLLAAPNLVESKVLRMLNEEGESHYEPAAAAGNLKFVAQSRSASAPRALYKTQRTTSVPVESAATHPAQISFSSRTHKETKVVAWPPTSSSVELNDAAEERNLETKEESIAEQPATKIAPPVPPKPRRNTEELDAIMAQPLKKDTVVPAPFASNELVGDRPLIAKPPPPAGLVSFTLRDQLPFSNAPAATVPSEPLFKKSTPLRRLGDMVWPPKKPGQQGSEEQQDETDLSKPRREAKNYRQFFLQNQLPASFPTYRAPPGTQHFGLENGENETPM